MCESTIHYARKRLKITRKKDPRYRERCPQKRRRYLQLRERYRRRGYRFIYVDESGFEPDSYRRYGYARRGVKVHGLHSGQRRPRTNLLVAQGMSRLLATGLFTGSCTTGVCNQWLKEEFCPHLNPQTVVVMDNAIFHKSKKARELIEARGAVLLYLPPTPPPSIPSSIALG